MKKIINALISHSGKNFCVQSDSVAGCYATAKTAEQAKQEFIQAVDFYLDTLSVDGEQLPFEKGDYTMEFSYTTEALSFFF
ncbi:MAG: hypothetical protein J6M30_05795 [Bacteroidales bacterium]|nr:hypothetical protein [Bacteroidales bacterium]